MDVEINASDQSMESETEENSSSSPSLSSAETDEELKIERITLKARKDRRSRGKWKLLSTKKKFKAEWLTTYSWIEKDDDNPLLAFCKVCYLSINAVKTTLEIHQKSKRHLKNLRKSEQESEPLQLPEFKRDDKPADPKPSNVQPQISHLHPPPPQLFQPQPQQQPHPQQQIHPQLQPHPQHFMPPPPQPAIGIDQITDEQISFFAESQADAAHQAVTSIIDRLVEKYHENRVINLKIQNDAIYELNAERAKIARTIDQKKLERRLQEESYKREAQDAHYRNLSAEHDSKMRAMERERDAKLRAVEQELVFAKQEYEKKVRLLDSQLNSMK